MSTLSDLQKKLQKESEGIMFPFRTATVSTTQPVLDTATDGIMSVTGKKYIGPDATIQYSPEGQRQLKEIEKGMLPQFDQTQFPDIGKGKVEDRGGAAPLPIDTTPIPQPEAPSIDPCPPGFKLVNGVCQPIEKQKSDRQEFTNKPRDIGGTAQALSQITDVMQEQGVGNFGQDANYTIDNSTVLSKLGFLGKLVDSIFFKNPADKKLQTLGSTEGINVIENEDGTYNVNITEQGKTNFGRLQTKESLAGNLASTQKTDAQGNIIRAPNGQLMIQGPLTLSAFGKTDLFTPENQIVRKKGETDTDFSKRLQDRTQTVDKLNQDEKNKLLSELNAALGITSTPDTKPEKFGTLDTGEITIEDLPPIMPGESGAVSESGEGVTQRRIPKIIQKLNDKKNAYSTETDSIRREQKRIEYETALDNADTIFETSVKQSSGSELSSEQKQYLDSDTRKARAGESKNRDGSLDSRKGFVAGRENSGYGFRATSANSTKQKNGSVTFDQRFK